MATTYQYDVFLSRATADKPPVETLARRLREAGLKPFLDQWHLIPGQPWQEGLVGLQVLERRDVDAQAQRVMSEHGQPPPTRTPNPAEKPS